MRIPQQLGRAALILASAVAMHAGQSPSFTVIHTFTGPDGATPFANLLLSGNILYGTTYGGGAYNAGTVFQVNTTTNAETVMHSFAGGPTDGAAPLAGLFRDPAGDLLGATWGGGAHFLGTVFKIPAAGGFQLLHSFKGEPTEGSGPAGTPVMDDAGNLYGTTYTGGNSTGYGTTYEILANGTFKEGQSFSPDGALPRAGLFLANGNLYGTTYGGGSHNYGGTVFQAKVTPPLYTFTGGADGSQPLAGLIGDGQGNLYGTTSDGGSGNFGNGDGVIFLVNATTGQETVLHTFTGQDGAAPSGSLVRDAQGNLYGTTMLGGHYGYGAVFELSASGTLTTLYSFTGGADGASPYAGLVMDGSGNLWGVASAGGSAAAPGGYGTLFKIVPVVP